MAKRTYNYEQRDGYIAVCFGKQELGRILHTTVVNVDGMEYHGYYYRACATGFFGEHTLYPSVDAVKKFLEGPSLARLPLTV